MIKKNIYINDNYPNLGTFVLNQRLGLSWNIYKFLLNYFQVPVSYF